MHSLTKRHLTDNELNQLIISGFGTTKTVIKTLPLTDGYFNSSYLIAFTDGQQVVLKVAPPPNVRVLTYEQHLMIHEVMAMKTMLSNHILVPEVLYYDDSKGIIDSDYFFMSFLEGTPLDKIKSQLSPDELDALYGDLGSMISSLHKETYSFFGEIGNPDKQYSDWFSCFQAMISDLMDDAMAIDLSLPISKTDVLTLINTYRSDLDQIKHANLIHKDLWDGNIFINPKSKQLTGIIDCERALYADPLLEIVCGHYEGNTSFVEAYYHRTEFTDSEKNRCLLYQLYLFLLMVIECPYRQYPTNDQFNWASERLEQILKALS